MELYMYMEIKSQCENNKSLIQCVFFAIFFICNTCQPPAYLSTSLYGSLTIVRYINQFNRLQLSAKREKETKRDEVIKKILKTQHESMRFSFLMTFKI